MPTQRSHRLQKAIDAGSILAGLSQPSSANQKAAPKTLSSILHRRLGEFRDAFGDVRGDEEPLNDILDGGEIEEKDEEGLKRLTAGYSLDVLGRLHSEVEEYEQASHDQNTSVPVGEGGRAPLLGMNDFRVITTLGSLVARWGISPLLQPGVLPSALTSNPPSSSRLPGQDEPKIQEITELPESKVQSLGLEDQVAKILQLLLPSPSESSRPSSSKTPLQSLSETFQFSSRLLPTVLVPFLAAILQLGYGETKERREASGTGRWRDCAEEVLKLIPPSAAMSTLFLLLSSSSSSRTPSLGWLREASSSLLSIQLLREGGVRGLLKVVVGDGDNEPPVRQMEQVAKILLTPPSTGLTTDAYFSYIIDSLLSILSPPPPLTHDPKSATRQLPLPPAYIRSTCFIISSIFSRKPQMARDIVLPLIHKGFIPRPILASTSNKLGDGGEDEGERGQLDPIVIPNRSLVETLTVLKYLLLNADPSPDFYTTLISPILGPLFDLYSHFHGSSSGGNVGIDVGSVEVRKEEEDVRGTVEELLLVTFKVEGAESAAKSIRELVGALEEGREWSGVGMKEGEGLKYSWSKDEDGRLVLRAGRQGRDVLPGGEGEMERDEELMRLRCDPKAVGDWLKRLARKEIDSTLFLRWLDELEALRGEMEGREADIGLLKRVLLRLQLVATMMGELGSSILQKPIEILAFVKHALDAPVRQPLSEPSQSVREPSARRRGEGLGLSDLKIVDVSGQENEEEPTMEGEEEEIKMAGLEGLSLDEQILVTGLSLLLAVLEAESALSPTSTNMLSLILERLQELSMSENEEIATLSRSARTLVTLKLASAVPGSSATSKGPTSTGADPFRESRAKYQEALKFLQDPMLPVKAQGLSILRSLVVSSASPSSEMSLDPALTPAILDIFLNAVEDDDSFLYLNAVKGLSSMADVFGREVVRRLVRAYAIEGLDGVRGDGAERELDRKLRVGEALVQVIQRAGEAFGVLVDYVVPPLLQVFRDQTLSIPLRSSSLTVLATCTEISPLALLPYSNDLTDASLTLLSIESRPTPKKREPEPEPTKNKYGPKYEETPDPMTKDPKHPSLRRSAILFLGLLFRSSMSSGQIDRRAIEVLGGQVRRSMTVLEYVAATDRDGLVRHQAQEVAEEMKEVVTGLMLGGAS